MTKIVIGNINYSSWSLRGWLAARALDPAAEIIRIPLFTEGYQERILEHAPVALVPILKTGDTVIWDSLAIAEYVAEIRPELWPADQSTRARARSICAEMHSGFGEIRSRMPMNCRATNRSVKIDDALQAEISRVQNIWNGCLSASNGPWLFGEYSIADIMFAPVVSRFNTYGITLSAVGAAYRDHVLASEPMMQWYEMARNETESIERAEVGR